MQLPGRMHALEKWYQACDLMHIFSRICRKLRFAAGSMDEFCLFEKRITRLTCSNPILHTWVGGQGLKQRAGSSQQFAAGRQCQCEEPGPWWYHWAATTIVVACLVSAKVAVPVWHTSVGQTGFAGFIDIGRYLILISEAAVG